MCKLLLKLIQDIGIKCFPEMADTLHSHIFEVLTYCIDEFIPIV